MDLMTKKTVSFEEFAEAVRTIKIFDSPLYRNGFTKKGLKVLYNELYLNWTHLGKAPLKHCALYARIALREIKIDDLWEKTGFDELEDLEYNHDVYHVSDTKVITDAII